MAFRRLVWMLPIVLASACGDASLTTSSTTAPESTAAASTAPPGPSSTATSSVPAVDTIVEWLEAQQANGFGEVIINPNWAVTDAVIVTAFTQVPAIDGDLVVALADGRVAPIPPDMASLLPSPPTGTPDIRLEHVGGDPLVVLVADDRQTVVASRLDTATLTWTAIVGVESLEPSERLDLYAAGEYALFVHWDTTASDSYRQWGQIVSPDGTVTTMSAPPVDTPMWFTNDAGGRALLLGLDTVAGASPDLRSPVAFDPDTNSWLAIPAPDWLTCATGGCLWLDRHEYIDRQFFRTTPSGIVATLPDGSYGLLDPIALTWRRLADPPLPLSGPIVSAVGDDRLLVLPGVDVDGRQALGTAVWLDIPSGTWTTEQVVDLPGETPPVWWEPRWWGEVLLLGADPDETGNPPRVAIDLSTGDTRPPTADELTAWSALTYQMPIGDAIDAWRLRIASAGS